MARNQRKPNALIAAATRIERRDPKKARGQMAQAQEWHEEAWGAYDDVPEIKESIRYRGDQLAKLRLFAAVNNPDDPGGTPIPVTDEASGVPSDVAATAAMEVARMHSQLGGQGEILRMLDMNLSIVGECYLVGYTPRTLPVPDGSPLGTMPEVTPEDWVIRSVSEVVVEGSGMTQKYLVRRDDNDKDGTPLEDGDTIIRIWLRHPRWSNQPDCAMRGLLGECRILQVHCQQLLAHSYRALSAGILTVPNELSFGNPDPTGDPDAPLADDLNAALDEILGGPVDDPTDPHTVQPGVLRGPAEYLKSDVLRRISFYDPAVVEGIEARIKARVERIARGLNLPVEKIMGHQATTYANAEQVDEDEFGDFLEPSATTAVDALTYSFLAPQMREAGGTAAEWADRVFIWYDPSDLIAQPDQEKNATDAWDRSVISNAALRRAMGYGEDDAPEPLEVLQRAGLRASGFQGPDVTLALLQMLGEPIDVVVPQTGSSVAPENLPASVEMAEVLALLSAARPSIRADSRPSTDYGRQLTDIDRELRTRVLAATNAAMGAALDRAANRLSTRAAGTPSRAVLNSVPRRQRFAHLGPSLVADIMGDEDPLSGAWDGLEADYLLWGSDAQAQARTVAGEATGTDQSGLEDEQSRNLADSWVWLAGALTVLANERIWDPSPSLPALGEFDPSLTVPPGLARAATARAGGAAGLITAGTGAWVTMADGGTRPAGGIGTGETIRGALRDGGAGIEGYQWQYGPAFRKQPFVEHRALDGKVVANFDDSSLSGGGWTGFGFWFPGDHAGCSCDVAPVIIPARRVL